MRLFPLHWKTKKRDINRIAVVYPQGSELTCLVALGRIFDKPNPLPGSLELKDFLCRRMRVHPLKENVASQVILLIMTTSSQRKGRIRQIHCPGGEKRGEFKDINVTLLRLLPNTPGFRPYSRAIKSGFSLLHDHSSNSWNLFRDVEA